jgi:hypothetical protein
MNFGLLYLAASYNLNWPAERSGIMINRNRLLAKIMQPYSNQDQRFEIMVHPVI